MCSHLTHCDYYYVHGCTEPTVVTSAQLAVCWYVLSSGQFDNSLTVYMLSVSETRFWQCWFGHQTCESVISTMTINNGVLCVSLWLSLVVEVSVSDVCCWINPVRIRQTHWYVLYHLYDAFISLTVHLYQFVLHSMSYIPESFLFVGPFSGAFHKQSYYSNNSMLIANHWNQFWWRGTAAVAPPLFRPGNPALCGSRPLVTPYYCRLYCMFDLSVYYLFLQYFDTFVSNGVISNDLVWR